MNQTQQTPSHSEKENLPPEYRHLKRPKPSARVDSWGCGFYFGLLWTAASFLFLFMMIWILYRDNHEYNLLSREGIPSTATITQLKMDKGDDTIRHLVYYQFTANVNGDPRNFQDINSVSQQIYSSLKVGQPIEILYAASNPAVSVIKSRFEPPDATAQFFTAIFGGVSGLSALIGLGVVYFGVKLREKSRKLDERGVQTQGVIFDRWKDWDGDNHVFHYVAVAFKAPSPRGGQRIYAHAEHNAEIYEKYEIGASLTVEYLPKYPSVCRIKIN